MSNNAQENMQLNDSLTQSLLQVNKLLYKMPPMIGIASKKHHRIDYFQSSNYVNGEVMVLDSQTGSEFVNPKTSYLKLNILPNGDGSFNTGSVGNIINRIVVRTRTGKEISRTENANLLIKNKQIYECPQDWKLTNGLSQGYNKDQEAAVETVPVGGKVYILPLWVIPCFNVDCLLPPQMMEGLRIEITLESPNVAFGPTSIGPTVPSTVANFGVSRPEIHWDSVDLADQFKRKIAEMAARQGLNIVHKEYFHTIVASSSSGQTQFNFDVKKAASKALRLMIVSRDQANISNAGADGMGSSQYDYINYQSRIGAIYYPNAPLKVDDITEDGNAESYYQTLYCAGKVDQCWYPSSVNPEQYTALESGTFNQLNSLVMFNYNKSTVSDLQGSQVNNSRAILVDLEAQAPSTGGAPAAYARRLDVYLEHLRASKYFTSNCEVRD
jgi:hypothetical protein